MAKLLVVEDEDDLIDLYAAQLGSGGHEVLTASSGAEALSILEKNSDTALVIADISLSGEMNGVAMVGAARRLNPDLPVLFISGDVTRAQSEAGSLNGRISVLQKPFRRSELLENVAKMLNG